MRIPAMSPIRRIHRLTSARTAQAPKGSAAIMSPMRDRLMDLVASRKGHFKLESGHHGELWLDLDQLFIRPVDIRPFAKELADHLAAHQPEVVCGPMIGGAFVAQMVAEELNLSFTYAERLAHPERNGLYSVEYRLPPVARASVRGKRVAIVDDGISAGSAIRGTLTDLEANGAEPVALGALIVLGSAASSFATSRNLPLEAVTTLPYNLWIPTECPLCASDVPLEEPGQPQA